MSEVTSLNKQLDYVQARSTRALVVSGVAKQDVNVESSLLSAVAQMSAMLAVTRLRPLEPSRMASMATALHVMLNAWERMYPGEVLRFDAEGTLSMPATLRCAWQRHPRPLLASRGEIGIAEFGPAACDGEIGHGLHYIREICAASLHALRPSTHDRGSFWQRRLPCYE